MWTPTGEPSIHASMAPPLTHDQNSLEDQTTPQERRPEIFEIEDTCARPIQNLPFYTLEEHRRLPRRSHPKRIWARHFAGWRVIVLGSWLNILLFMLPAALVVEITLPAAPALAFSLCIMGLIPLVRLHDMAVANLALRVGGSKTGLLNASMSNFVELVVAISALRKCELRVVHSSLVGSMLSKLLLALGLCFFAGGMRFSEQGFNQTATQVHSSLLTISVGVLLLPAAFHFTLSLDAEGVDAQKREILHMSHGVSIVLILIYISYLAFQFWSHPHLYNDHHDKKSARLPATRNITRQNSRSEISPRGSVSGIKSNPTSSTNALSPTSDISPDLKSSRPILGGIVPGGVFELDSSNTLTLDPVPRSTGPPDGSVLGSVPSSQDDHAITQINAGQPMKPPKEPDLSWFMTVLLLLIVTMAVAVTADWLVESMDGVSTSVSKDWVALILLPLVSTVAECITAMRVSVKDELSFSMSVAVGSTIQTALFVIPLMNLLAWAMKKPLTLLMDPFQSLVLYISVQTASSVIADGKSNWLGGAILFALYIIIAVAFWFYPGSAPLDFLVACPK